MGRSKGQTFTHAKTFGDDPILFRLIQRYLSWRAVHSTHALSYEDVSSSRTDAPRSVMSQPSAGARWRLRWAAQWSIGLLVLPPWSPWAWLHTVLPGRGRIHQVPHVLTNSTHNTQWAARLLLYSFCVWRFHFGNKLLWFSVSIKDDWAFPMYWLRWTSGICADIVIKG